MIDRLLFIRNVIIPIHYTCMSSNQIYNVSKDKNIKQYNEKISYTGVTLSALHRDKYLSFCSFREFAKLILFFFVRQLSYLILLLLLKAY